MKRTTRNTNLPCRLAVCAGQYKFSLQTFVYNPQALQCRLRIQSPYGVLVFVALHDSSGRSPCVVHARPKWCRTNTAKWLLVVVSTYISPTLMTGVRLPRVHDLE